MIRSLFEYYIVTIVVSMLMCVGTSSIWEFSNY